MRSMTSRVHSSENIIYRLFRIMLAYTRKSEHICNAAEEENSASEAYSTCWAGALLPLGTATCCVILYFVFNYCLVFVSVLYYFLYLLLLSVFQLSTLLYLLVFVPWNLLIVWWYEEPVFETIYLTSKLITFWCRIHTDTHIFISN